MNIFKNLPEVENLLNKHNNRNEIFNVNGHLHTPYSFCSFSNIEQIFEMATAENIKVLGINDFFTTDGYNEFAKFSLENKILPLFNIEFMGLFKDLQEKDVRINDPGNPGRIYFSGKGLAFPSCSSNEKRTFIKKLQQQSQLQVKEMIYKANLLMISIESAISINFEQIKARYAKELVRERHIAKAIREAVFNTFPSDEQKKYFFRKMFNAEMVANLQDEAVVEDEIRARILKKGGAAFVEESTDAFPPIESIIDFILDAGGIPCYPVLLDDKNGNFTQFEGDWDAMHKTLEKLNVKCIELIPSRNSEEILTKFVKFFDDKGYAITFGTEHNTPGIFPIEVKLEKTKVLSSYLKEINYKGCCLIAAHQYLVAKGLEGYVNKQGISDSENINYYIELGNDVIKEFCGK